LRLHDYSQLALDSTTGIYFAGISYFPTVTEIVDDDIIYTTEILSSENYRPDKIADRLWGIPDLSWVLDVLNDFQEGIQEYKRGVTIKYVSFDRLKKAGII